VYDRVPGDRLETYQQWRELDLNRSGVMIERRFPDLAQAKADFR